MLSVPVICVQQCTINNILVEIRSNIYSDLLATEDSSVRIAAGVFPSTSNATFFLSSDSRAGQQVTTLISNY